MKSYDIAAYTYSADIYCPRCTVEQIAGRRYPAFADLDAEQALDILAPQWHVDRMDERSYDSGDFPKVVFVDMLEVDERCGQCGCELP